MRRPWLPLLAASAALLITAAPALACGGLIGPNGAVNLLRTTTFAGYHDGVEHYVTSFEFAGGGGAFGSIMPLPGIPTDVERGGDWTLQRLIRETDPVAGVRTSAPPARRSARDEAEVLLETTHRRARHHDPARRRRRGRPVGQEPRLPAAARCTRGARLLRRPQPDLHGRGLRRRRGRRARPGDRRRHAGPPHHPDRQPVGSAADPGARQGRRRAGRGRRLPADRHRPALLPNAGAFGEGDGLILDHSAAATDSLLADLRSDVGMEWVPEDAWLTKVVVASDAGDLDFDLAIDASGAGKPSAIDAGYAPFGSRPAPRSPVPAVLLLAATGAIGRAGRC